MNKILLSGFLICLAFGTMGRPIEQVSAPGFPNATNHTCQECENLIDIITVDSKLLNKTISSIIEIVENICREIDGPSGKECLYVVDEIQQIVTWITDGMTSPVICKRLGFCSNSTNYHKQSCLDDFS
tara:strand:+ start:160 stop:543 length:384 start_codon:yes stop_codon:yes gene_type:complete